MNSIPTQVYSEAYKALKLLVSKKYKELELICNGMRLTAFEMESVIDEYGKILVLPDYLPNEYMDVVKIDNSSSYSVWVNLFSHEEGLSDLKLLLTIILKDNNNSIEVDDIRAI